MAIDLSGQDPLFQGLASGLRQLSQSELQNMQRRRQQQEQVPGLRSLFPNATDEELQGIAAMPARSQAQAVQQAQEMQGFQGAQEATQRAAQNIGLDALGGEQQQPQGQPQQPMETQGQQPQMPQQQEQLPQQDQQVAQQPQMPQQPQGVPQDQQQQPQQAMTDNKQFQSLKQQAEQQGIGEDETFSIKSKLGGKPMESYRSLQNYLEENNPEYRRKKRALEEASRAVDESPNPAAMRQNQKRYDRKKKEFSDFYNEKLEDFKQSKEDVRALLKPNSPFSKLVERTEEDENVLNRTLYHLNQARNTPPEDRPNFWGYLVSGFKRGGLADTLIRKAPQINNLAGTDDNTLMGNIGPGIIGKVMGDSIGDVTNSIAQVINRLTPEGAQLQDHLNALKNDLNRSMKYAKDTMGEHKFNKFLGQTITMFSSQQALENFYNMSESLTRIGYADKFALDKVLEENDGMPVKDYKTRMKAYKDAYLKDLTNELERVTDESYQRVVEAQDSAPIGEFMKGGKWWQALQEAAARLFREGEETQAPGLIGLDQNLF